MLFANVLVKRWHMNETMRVIEEHFFNNNDAQKLSNQPSWRWQRNVKHSAPLKHSHCYPQRNCTNYHLIEKNSFQQSLHLFVGWSWHTRFLNFVLVELGRTLEVVNSGQETTESPKLSREVAVQKLSLVSNDA